MKPLSLREALAKKLTKKERDVLISSFDQIGDMAIIEIPDLLVKKEKLIGETLLSQHKNLKTVAKKVGQHYGKYRRQKLKILAGRKSKTANYVESGVRFFVNYEQAYFSPRLGTDRLRLAKRIKKGETILVLFGGVAPYPLVFRKHSDAGSIYSIEMNPKGHELAEKNVILNKMKDIHLLCGDARTVAPKLKKKFDRVHMCLPKTAWNFLGIALNAVKKGGLIDYYAFWHQDHFEKEKKRLKSEIKRLGFSCKILHADKCGDHKPRVYRVCIELKIT